MTPDRITARNRANARKSTGPRTQEGKAIVAGNARQHGATARPDPEDIAAWLAIILDRPEITPADLLPSEEAGYRALALAEAEVRCVAAERALRDFEAGQEEPDETVKDLRGMGQMILDELLENGGTKKEIRSGVSLLKRIAMVDFRETRPGGKRHRLLRRYLGEARAQRRKAFEAWASLRNAETAPMQFEAPESRNKASALA